MASVHQLTGLLASSGMPGLEWWDAVESAYQDMCHILTEDVNTEELSNRASRPLMVILPTGNYACKLASPRDVLKCLAFGTLRAELFVEVMWQNITRAQDRGSKVQAYHVSERRSLLQVSGFMFSVQYVESPELVRSFPRIVDVPRAFQAELGDEVDEIVETIRDLKLLKDQSEKYPQFAQTYYILRSWMISSGLYQGGRGGQSLILSKKRIACFDEELLRELSWSILMNSDNENGCGEISAEVSSYLLRHESCLRSSAKDSCSFYYDSEGPFACRWSDNQFRSVHEEFRILYEALTREAGQQISERPLDDRLDQSLWPLFSRQFFEKLFYQSYVRVTMQFSGQSQIAGTKMMQFIEERILDLIQALENSKGVVHLRPWPTKLVDIHAKEDDHPYEGYWIIGVSVNGNTTQGVLESVLSIWNDKICTSHRYSATAMVIHAELIGREKMLHQDVKEDLREWPLPLAKPDPRYTLDRITKGVSEIALPASTAQPQSPRKLRPALDVLSRLRHDQTFDLDDHVVGYTDRHTGIQEKAAGTWVSDSTDEEWIPQGRILYFRRVSDGKKVWDRATKYDVVFK